MSRLACSPRWEELDLDREKLMRWVNLSVNLYGLARNYELAGKVKGMDVLYALPLLSMCNDKEVWLRTHLMKWDRFVDGEVEYREYKGFIIPRMMNADNCFRLQQRMKLRWRRDAFCGPWWGIFSVLMVLTGTLAMQRDNYLMWSVS